MSDEASKEEFVLKEMEYGAARNGSSSKWKNAAFVEGQNGSGEPIGTSDKNHISVNSSEETVLDLYPLKFSSSNGSVYDYQNDAANKADDVKECQVFSQSKIHPSELADTYRVIAKATGVPKHQNIEKAIEPKEINHKHQVTWSKNNEFKYTSLKLWKDCSVKTVFPFPKGDMSTSCGTPIRSAIKGQVDEVESALYFGTTQGNNESRAFGGLRFL